MHEGCSVSKRVKCGAQALREAEAGAPWIWDMGGTLEAGAPWRWDMGGTLQHIVLGGRNLGVSVLECPTDCFVVHPLETPDAIRALRLEKVLVRRGLLGRPHTQETKNQQTRQRPCPPPSCVHAKYILGPHHASDQGLYRTGGTSSLGKNTWQPG